MSKPKILSGHFSPWGMVCSPGRLMKLGNGFPRGLDPWQVFLFRDHFHLRNPSSVKWFSLLFSFPKFLSVNLSPALLQPPSLFLLPRAPGVFVHSHTCTHACICLPPGSPCGFKALILIRFELTYCQSSFSCSSESTGIYHQDWDLG